MTDPNGPLRIGILGAARIAPAAIIAPAARIPEVEVVAIAARDPKRARAFAQHHGIDRALNSYEELVTDPDINAIYNPLPNSQHAAWGIRALQSGKHLLCEKPIAANAEEATEMAAVAERSGCVLMEAFHYRYHPLMARVLDIVQSGEIGDLRHIEATMCIPLYRWWDIRWRYDLGGGALMDVGCYTIHFIRTVAGEEPEVTRARVWLRSPQIDRVAKADFRFPSGITATIHCSMWSPNLVNLGAKVVGERGELDILNPFVPQRFHRLTIRTATGTRHETFGRTASYLYQLRAFVDAVKTRAPFPTDTRDAIANMRVIDNAYRAASLKPRGT